MAPLFKVTLEGTFSEIFYVRAECDDFARDIAIERVLDDPLHYLLPFDTEDVEEVEIEDLDDIDEDEVLG
jgi:hypothetical protein